MDTRLTEAKKMSRRIPTESNNEWMIKTIEDLVEEKEEYLEVIRDFLMFHSVECRGKRLIISIQNKEKQDKLFSCVIGALEGLETRGYIKREKSDDLMFEMVHSHKKGR